MKISTFQTYFIFEFRLSSYFGGIIELCMTCFYFVKGSWTTLEKILKFYAFILLPTFITNIKQARYWDNEIYKFISIKIQNGHRRSSAKQ